MTEEDPLQSHLDTDRKKEIKRTNRSHTLLTPSYENNSDTDRGIKMSPARTSAIYS